jgi:phospholipid/cholesterol/gamma-HCH transport system substrate-binding protein
MAPQRSGVEQSGVQHSGTLAVDRSRWTEIWVGAAVLAAAALFLGYALAHTGGLMAQAGYPLTAQFGDAGALAPGADVRVAGVKVGTVTGVTLDPKTYQAKTTLLIDNAIQLPADSTVKITQDSLLGGEHLAVEPGGSLQNLKPGQAFENTQGAVDLFGLIGQVLRPQTPAGSSSTGSAPPPTTTPGGP